MWQTSSGCLVKDATCTPPWSLPTPPINSGSGCSSALAGVGYRLVCLSVCLSPPACLTSLSTRLSILHSDCPCLHLLDYKAICPSVWPFICLSTCVRPWLTCPPISLLPGIPFPIIVAWAFGKLYYDNEKWVTQEVFWSSVLCLRAINHTCTSLQSIDIVWVLYVRDDKQTFSCQAKKNLGFDEAI